MPAAVLSDRLWIRKRDVVGPPSVFAPDWEFKVPASKTAKGRQQKLLVAFLREQAELAGEDPDEAVDGMDFHDYIVKNWSDMGDWWALSRGDLTACQNLCNRLGLEVKDQRVKSPWPEELKKLKMMMPPRDYQVVPLNEWKARGGCLKAPPAFGKTYVMCDSMVSKQCWTLFVTHTDTLASQFIGRFREGSRGQPITNCKEVEEEVGYKIVGRLTKKEQLYPITVATWQSFIGKNGRARLKKLRKVFGRIVVDEVHAFAAPQPTSVIDAFWAEERCGVSATYNRKDTFQNSLFKVVGPITTIGKMEELPVSAYMIASDFFWPEPAIPLQRDWSDMLTDISKDEDRNDKVLDWLNFDVQEGRSIIVISERVQWCYHMQAELHQRYGIPSMVVQGSLESKKAMALREKAETAIENGDIQVLFATSVFKLGVDIPRLNTMYMPFPMSNALNLDQMLGRIRRLYPGKPRPVFRYFVDGGAGVIYGCARSTASSLSKTEGVTLRFIKKHSSAMAAMAVIKEAVRRGQEPTEEKAVKKEAAPKSFKKLKTDGGKSVEALFDELIEKTAAKTYRRRMDT